MSGTLGTIRVILGHKRHLIQIPPSHRNHNTIEVGGCWRSEVNRSARFFLWKIMLH